MLTSQSKEVSLRSRQQDPDKHCRRKSGVRVTLEQTSSHNVQQCPAILPVPPITCSTVQEGTPISIRNYIRVNVSISSLKIHEICQSAFAIVAILNALKCKTLGGIHMQVSYSTGATHIHTHYSTLRGRIKGTASAAFVIQNRF